MTEEVAISDGRNETYKKAAKTICDFIAEAGQEIEHSDQITEAVRQEFLAKFSPQKLAAISDAELLKTMFYSDKTTNDSMCYWLERNTKINAEFGGILGGAAYKFDLFYHQEVKKWETGASTKPQELSEDEALELGKKIRDGIVQGATIIDAVKDLNNVAQYDKMDASLRGVLGQYSQHAWIHKYYSLVFPKKVATWHVESLQRHFLYAYGIKPSSTYYGRSGQLAIIANYAQVSTSLFAKASAKKFGEIKTFYRIGTTSNDGNTKHFPKWLQDNIVAIGWTDIGPLNELSEKSRAATIRKKLLEKYYKNANQAGIATRRAKEINRFYTTDENSIFVAKDGDRLLGLGDNVGEYKFDENREFGHIKPVVWHTCFGMEERLPAMEGAKYPVCDKLSDEENLLFLYAKYYNNINQEPLAMAMGTNMPVFDNHVVSRQKKQPLNQILYGVPGTGKTYNSIEYANAIIENRDICTKQSTDEERRELMKKYDSYVNAGRIVFTTFHQSYGYEDFIQGIRPDTNCDNIRFMKVDGVFKKIADKAANDSGNNYVIIIDEINRGNISKIFGELITLIEEDKRWGEINQLKATLPSGDTFMVPNNLYIIGTMNTADKSISLLDTALRRRFAFIEMQPDELLIADAKLREVVTTLNVYLKAELRSTDFLIGHAFFMGKGESDLAEIMNRNIVPLLYEYFYNDEDKVKKALACLKNTGFSVSNEQNGRIKIKKD